MLDIASSKSKKKNLDKIDYVHGYAENLPFKDIAISMDVCYYFIWYKKF